MKLNKELSPPIPPLIFSKKRKRSDPIFKDIFARLAECHTPNVTRARFYRGLGGQKYPLKPVRAARNHITPKDRSSDRNNPSAEFKAPAPRDSSSSAERNSQISRSKIQPFNFQAYYEEYVSKYRSINRRLRSPTKRRRYDRY
eukprot:TRINITY_DN956_c0_g2_i1.p1 TRINITY_DN956_c0_g2~~TRINITY_DN956_c0_g2_i1.p1  ORF type:complete len:143 (+),score=18.50 TRINITY_DN956_c0_g2_i1:139-567(+)